jgi:uncharacterized membrane protein
MAIREPIRNPVEWGYDQLKRASSFMGWAGDSLHRGLGTGYATPPAVRRIGVADLADALASGLRDFAAYRTDVIFLCVIYPIAGLVLARLAFGYDMLPLLFPLASGFALIGPVAAVGLYEMSRRREQGLTICWADAFRVVRSPSFGEILALGLLLLAIFLLWLAAAYGIYRLTLGPEPPASAEAFVRDVFTTHAGWMLIAVGVGVGFCFAVVVLAISVVSFPLLLDREVGLGTAVRTSVRAVLANAAPMALWGLIVAGGLVLGSIPLLVGLVIVMPVLGHATWHLYRKVVC